MPARTSGFHISDILELNDPKPSSEEADVPGKLLYQARVAQICEAEIYKKPFFFFHSLNQQEAQRFCRR